MHLCIQAVRHVRFDCRQGSWAVLQCHCKTFVSRGYLQCSQAECREPSVCLFQGEIGDRSCLLGTLLVMRSQETLPSSSGFLFSSFLPARSSLLFVSLLSVFLLFFTVALFSTHFTSLYLLHITFTPILLLRLSDLILNFHFLSLPSSTHCLVYSLSSSNPYSPFPSRCFTLGHLWCLCVCVRARVNACSHASICVLAVLKPSPTSLPRSLELLPAKH